MAIKFSVLFFVLNLFNTSALDTKIVFSRKNLTRVNKTVKHFLNKPSKSMSRKPSSTSKVQNKECLYGGWISITKNLNNKTQCVPPWDVKKELKNMGHLVYSHECGDSKFFRCNPDIFGPGPVEKNAKYNSGKGKFNNQKFGICVKKGGYNTLVDKCHTASFWIIDRASKNKKSDTLTWIDRLGDQELVQKFKNNKIFVTSINRICNNIKYKKNAKKYNDCKKIKEGLGSINPFLSDYLKGNSRFKLTNDKFRSNFRIVPVSFLDKTKNCNPQIKDKSIYICNKKKLTLLKLTPDEFIQCSKKSLMMNKQQESELGQYETSNPFPNLDFLKDSKKELKRKIRLIFKKTLSNGKISFKSGLFYTINNKSLQFLTPCFKKINTSNELNDRKKHKFSCRFNKEIDDVLIYRDDESGVLKVKITRDDRSIDEITDDDGLISILMSLKSLGESSHNYDNILKTHSEFKQVKLFLMSHYNKYYNNKYKNEKSKTAIALVKLIKDLDILGNKKVLRKNFKDELAKIFNPFYKEYLNDLSVNEGVHLFEFKRTIMKKTTKHIGFAKTLNLNTSVDFINRIADSKTYSKIDVTEMEIPLIKGHFGCYSHFNLSYDLDIMTNKGSNNRKIKDK